MIWAQTVFKSFLTWRLSSQSILYNFLSGSLCHLYDAGGGPLTLVVLGVSLVGSEDLDGGEAFDAELAADRLVDVAVDATDVDDALWKKK